jgi:hypothetical protein
MTDHINSTVFSPWAKPQGMFRAMARYQAIKGLKPVGLHRPLADSLLKDITCKCATCGGTGLCGTYGGLGWKICPACHGFGETYSITLDELQALRQQVLDRYPDAAPPGWAPGRPISCPIQEMAPGRMVEACPGVSGGPLQGELLFDDESETGVEFFPWGMCVSVEPSPRSIPRPPARPRLSWQGLWVLGKVLWQNLAA